RSRLGRLPGAWSPAVGIETFEGEIASRSPARRSLAARPDTRYLRLTRPRSDRAGRNTPTTEAWLPGRESPASRPGVRGDHRPRPWPLAAVAFGSRRNAALARGGRSSCPRQVWLPPSRSHRQTSSCPRAAATEASREGPLSNGNPPRCTQQWNRDVWGPD